MSFCSFSGLGSSIISLSSNKSTLANPSPPTLVTGYPTNSQIFLTWNKPSTDGSSPIVSYNVRYSDDDGLTWTLFNTTFTTIFGFINNLTNYKSYIFQVRANTMEIYGSWSSSSNSVFPIRMPSLRTFSSISSSFTARSWHMRSSYDGRKIIAFSGNQVHLSTNSGSTWSANISPATPVWGSSFISPDGNILLLGSSNGLLWRSTNNGDNWSSVVDSTLRNWVSISSSFNGNYYVATTYGYSSSGNATNGQIYFSSDYGSTWQLKTTFGWAVCAAISNDGQKIYIGIDGSESKYTTNQGTSWVTLTGINFNIWSAIFFNNETKMITHSNGTNMFIINDVSNINTGINIGGTTNGNWKRVNVSENGDSIIGISSTNCVISHDQSTLIKQPNFTNKSMSSLISNPTCHNIIASVINDHMYISNPITRIDSTNRWAISVSINTGSVTNLTKAFYINSSTNSTGGTATLSKVTDTSGLGTNSGRITVSSSTIDSLLNGNYDISGNVFSDSNCTTLVTDYQSVMINSLSPTNYFIPASSVGRFVVIKLPNTLLLRLTDVYYNTTNTNTTGFSMNVFGSNDNGTTYTQLLLNSVNIINTNNNIGLSQLTNISNDGLFNMFRISYTNTHTSSRNVKSQIIGQLFKS